MGFPETVLMERMTWSEIRKAIKDGATTVLLVAASVEQHGPHLPTGTDTLLAYDVAERVARGLGNTLVAPVIRPGCSDHHLGLPGTFSLPKEVFKEVLREHVANLMRHGFRSIAFISSHGGNVAPMREVARSLAPSCAAQGVKIISAVPENVTESIEVKLQSLERLGISPEMAGIHAGYLEVAWMLACHPEHVRTSSLEPGFVGEVDLERLLVEGITSISPNGVFGDPTGATAEAGAMVRDRWVEYLVEKIGRQL